MVSSVFLSHSSKNKPFVKKLYDDLTKEDIDVWFDKWEIKVGDSIIRKIEEGLNSHDYLAIVLSEDSVKSEWVRRELSAGLMREIESKSVVVLPILLEDCEIPILLREKRRADFRELYQIGYNELIESIEANEERQAIKQELDDLEPSEQIRLVRNMRAELTKMRRERKMFELSEMTLPFVVLSKLVGEKEARTYTNNFQDVRSVEELPLELQEVDIKTVSAEEYHRDYILHPAWKVLRRDTKMVWEEMPEMITDRVGREVGKVRIGRVGKEIGTVIIGAYKKLLDMYSELFEETFLKFKDEYDLDDAEWAEIQDEVRDLMERDFTPPEIRNYIITHIFSKTEEGTERLRNIWESGNYNPLSKEEIDHYHKLARESV